MAFRILNVVAAALLLGASISVRQGNDGWYFVIAFGVLLVVSLARLIACDLLAS